MAGILADNNWSEHYIRRGNPNAPTYYIIRRKNAKVGLFSNYAVFAGHIRYALSKGYIPVIDMKNYPNQMLDPKLLGKENSWEYYFKQPLNVGLEYAYSGENVILSQEYSPGGLAPVPMAFFKNKNNMLTEWRMLVKFGLLQIRPHLQKEINELYSKLFPPNTRVLGVHLRGTDYVAKKPKYHPIPPLRVRITKNYIEVQGMELP